MGLKFNGPKFKVRLPGNLLGIWSLIAAITLNLKLSTLNFLQWL